LTFSTSFQIFNLSITINIPKKFILLLSLNQIKYLDSLHFFISQLILNLFSLFLINFFKTLFI